MEDCTDSFVKECYIATETVFVPVTVTVCEDVISRRGANALEGDEVCSVEYATGLYEFRFAICDGREYAHLIPWDDPTHVCFRIPRFQTNKD